MEAHRRLYLHLHVTTLFSGQHPILILIFTYSNTQGGSSVMTSLHSTVNPELRATWLVAQSINWPLVQHTHTDISGGSESSLTLVGMGGVTTRCPSLTHEPIK